MRAVPRSAAEFLTPPQVAKRLGIEASKVRAWIESKRLRAVNIAENDGIGRRPRWRVRLSDLEEFLAAREAAPAKPVDRRRKKKHGRVIEFIS